MTRASGARGGPQANRPIFALPSGDRTVGLAQRILNRLIFDDFCYQAFVDRLARGCVYGARPTIFPSRTGAARSHGDDEPREFHARPEPDAQAHPLHGRDGGLSPRGGPHRSGPARAPGARGARLRAHLLRDGEAQGPARAAVRRGGARSSRPRRVTQVRNPDGLERLADGQIILNGRRCSART